MNRVFKIVGRYKAKEDQPSWARGIPHRQAKKHEYTSKEKFDRYGTETLDRWRRYYDVSVFELIDGEWIPYENN